MLQRAGASRLIAGVAAAEPAILLLIAPALLFPSPRRVLIALVVPLIWICHRLSGGSFIPPTPLNTSIAAVLAMGIVSLFVTFDAAFSLGKISGLFLGVVLYWAFVRWISTGPRLRVAQGGFLLAGAGLALVGLVGTNWFEKFAFLSPVQARLPRIIRGLPGAEEGFQPNAVAGCLVLFIPLQIALLLRAARAPVADALAPDALAPNALALNGTRTTRRRELALHAVLLGLTAGTLMLTQSRGAWVGLLAGAVAFLVWHSRQTRVAAALLAGAIVLVSVTFSPARVLDFAISQSGSGMASNVSGRLELWSRAIDGIQDFPLTGMGMNVFRRVQPILYPAFSTSPDIDIAHAHNHLLQVALDLGLPGLIAYLSIWIGTGVLLTQVHRRTDDPLHRAVASGLGAGLVAHFAFGMTDAIPLGAKVGVLFWMTLALAVALHNVTHKSRP